VNQHYKCVASRILNCLNNITKTVFMSLWEQTWCDGVGMIIILRFLLPCQTFVVIGHTSMKCSCGNGVL